MNAMQSGLSAIKHGLVRARHEPERAAYVAASVLVNIPKLKPVVKPLLMPLLSGRVLRSDAQDKGRGLLALAGNTIGDVVLLKPNSLVQGACGFAVNHLAYCDLLVRRGARLHLNSAAIRGIPLAVATAITVKKAPRYLGLVLGYGGTLATMSALAADPDLVTENTASRGFDLGGNLFLLSDFVLLLREVTARPNTSGMRLLEWW